MLHFDCSRARVVAAVLLVCGCGGQSPNSASSRATRSASPPASSSATPAGQSNITGTPLTGQPPAALPNLRRIAYTGELTVIVEDFSVAESELTERVRRFDAFVAKSDIDGSSGRARSGQWEVRVPSEKFHEFIDAVAALGTPELRQTKAEDKTEEYVDLEARVANKREIEQRVLKLIDARSRDLHEVISLEAELGRVREEVERLQGRLNLLARVTELSSVRITLRERLKFVPPATRTFWSQVQITWGRSFGRFVDFAQALLLCTVAVLPWTPVIAPGGAITWWVLRRAQRKPLSA